MRDDSEAIVHIHQHGRPRCKARVDDAGLAGSSKVSLCWVRFAHGAGWSCTAPIMVGRVGVEPTTSRLSGVRSNHLSYRPVPAAPSVAAKLRLMARYAALAELTDVQTSSR